MISYLKNFGIFEQDKKRNFDSKTCVQDKKVKVVLCELQHELALEMNSTKRATRSCI